MDTEQRKRLILSQEGQWIAIASQHGDDGSELIRASIDGCMNALIRVEGPAAAAEYSFALSDRVVGKLRAPTELPMNLIAPAPIEIKAADPPKPRPMRFFAIFIVGWLCGFLTGIATR